MYKLIAACLLAVLASPANADACPNSYRFVDFGSQGPDGVIRRGGTIFRAFDVAETRLLDPAGSVCRTVEAVARDGRALPIPVVSHIEVDPALAQVDLTALGLTAREDVNATADAGAARHRATLAQAGTVITRGDTYLCAVTPESTDLSCQIVSPYESVAAPVVYCDGQTCEMPSMVRNHQITVDAAWRQTTIGADDTRAEIMDKIQMIHDFLEGHI